MTFYFPRCFQSQNTRKCSLAVFFAASVLLAFGCASTSFQNHPGCEPLTDVIQSGPGKPYDLRVEGLRCLNPLLAYMPPLINHEVLRLAVIPSNDTVVQGLPQPLQEEIRAFVEMQAQDLKASFPRLEIVERARIDSVIRELKFQASGLVKDDNFVGVGRMLGADHLLIYHARVGVDRESEAFIRAGGHLRATVYGKVIHVQTGAVVFQQTSERSVYYRTPPNVGMTVTMPSDYLRVSLVKDTLPGLFFALYAASVPSPDGSFVTKEKDSDRVIVDFVLIGGPAYNAGLRQGDIITAVDGIPVRAGDPVLRDLDMIPRELYHLTIQREGREQTLAVRPVRRNSIGKSLLTEREELEFLRRLEKERASSPPAKP